MILSDKYALFRNPLSGEPFQEPEDTEWDYALMKALQVIEDFTDSNGILVWEKESDKINVQAKKRIDKFEAAKEAYTSGKNYKADRGEYFVPELNLHYWLSEEEWPTFSEWASSNSSGESDQKPPGEPTFVQG